MVEEYKKEVTNYLAELSKYLVNLSKECPTIKISSLEEWDIFESCIDDCSYLIKDMLFNRQNLSIFREFLNKYLNYDVVYGSGDNGKVLGYLIDENIYVRIENSPSELGVSTPRFDSIYDTIDFAPTSDLPVEPKEIKYTMSEVETRAYLAFVKKHKNCNGLISYIITPTPIGSELRIKCTSCGEEKDICDYNW